MIAQLNLKACSSDTRLCTHCKVYLNTFAASHEWCFFPCANYNIKYNFKFYIYISLKKTVFNYRGPIPRFQNEFSLIRNVVKIIVPYLLQCVYFTHSMIQSINIIKHFFEVGRVRDCLIILI